MTEHGSLTGRRRESLIDAIDRLVDVGTVISGDAIIRLADVDLIHLDLRLLLAAIIGSPASSGPAEEPPAGNGAGSSGTGDRGAGGGAALPRPSAPPGGGTGRPAGTQSREDERPTERLDQGLGQLVVAVVELVRQLLERQAVRRMRAGTLDQDQQERLGEALQALEQRMVELRDALGVTPSELDHAIGTVERMLDSSSTDPAGAGGQERRVS